MQVLTRMVTIRAFLKQFVRRERCLRMGLCKATTAVVLRAPDSLLDCLREEIARCPRVTVPRPRCYDKLALGLC